MRRPFVGGNWKMNTNAASAVGLARAVAEGVADERLRGRVDVAIFPPFVYLREVGAVLAAGSSAVVLGAQDVYFQPDGAFTGEISCAMLKDCGVRVVLTGHSERRHVLGESDELVNRKTRAALSAGLGCILCVGEKLEERERGQTDAVNERQVRAGLSGVNPEEMARMTIAYEPVWAIGTGNTAMPRDAQDAQAKIRGVLTSLYGRAIADAVRIQYGGSVAPAHVPSLMDQPDVDGGLVGGASLKPEQFAAIVHAAANSRA